jgi:hypothetical protein
MRRSHCCLPSEISYRNEKTGVMNIGVYYVLSRISGMFCGPGDLPARGLDAVLGVCDINGGKWQARRLPHTSSEPQPFSSLPSSIRIRPHSHATVSRGPKIAQNGMRSRLRDPSSTKSPVRRSDSRVHGDWSRFAPAACRLHKKSA